MKSHVNDKFTKTLLISYQDKLTNYIFLIGNIFDD